VPTADPPMSSAARNVQRPLRPGVAVPTPALPALLLALLAALTSSGCGGSPPPPAAGDEPPAGAVRRPSFIIVDVDTLRADRLGCYGNPRATSPRLDRLAGESLRFAWAFSQAPTTPPSQTSIFTGLYPSSHGVETRKDRLPEAVSTLASVLDGEGYATAAFVDGGYMSRGFGLARGYDVYDDDPGGLAVNGPRAIDWLRRNASDDFLLVVHTYDVHTPYDPPEPYRSLFLGELDAPPTPGFEPTAAVLEEVRRSRWEKPEPIVLPESDVAYSLALYDAGVRYVDDWLGGLLDELARLGIDERTAVVVLSDHGEEFQEHGSVLHDKLYATVNRIPLVLRPPGGGTGRVVDEVVQAIDVMPTLLEMAGAAVPPAVQGRSLAPYLAGGTLPARPAVSESVFYGGQRAVTAEDHRLLYWIRHRRSELYAFRQDPLEQRDLSPELPEVGSELSRELRLWKQRVDAAPPPAAGASSIPPEVEKQLRALGYIQ